MFQTEFMRLGAGIQQGTLPDRRPTGADPRTDGPGTDEGDLAARLAHALDLVCEPCEPRWVERPVWPGQHVRADLYDDGMSAGDDGLSHQIGHASGLPWDDAGGGSIVRGNRRALTCWNRVIG